jgi:hypothetical protein
MKMKLDKNRKLKKNSILYLNFIINNVSTKTKNLSFFIKISSKIFKFSIPSLTMTSFGAEFDAMNLELIQLKTKLYQIHQIPQETLSC